MFKKKIPFTLGYNSKFRGLKPTFWQKDLDHY